MVGMDDENRISSEYPATHSWAIRLLCGWSPLARSHSGGMVLAAFVTSAVSSGLMGFALPWLTLLLGGSASLVALLSAAQVATSLLLLIPAGIWADRVARRRLLQVAAVTQSVVALTLLGLALSGLLSIPILLLSAVVLAVAGCVEFAAGFGSVRLLVPDSELPSAQASLTVL